MDPIAPYPQPMRRIQTQSQTQSIRRWRRGRKTNINLVIPTAIQAVQAIQAIPTASSIPALLYRYWKACGARGGRS
jgi:hypothetical protein